MKDSEKTFLAAAIVLALVAGFTLAPWSISVAWGMTAVQIFGLQPLSFKSALLLIIAGNMVVYTLSEQPSDRRDKSDSPHDVATKTIARAVGRPLFSLLVMWVVANYIP